MEQNWKRFGLKINDFRDASNIDVSINILLSFWDSIH